MIFKRFKNMKRIYLLLAIIGLAIVSCHKDEVAQIVTPPIVDSSGIGKLQLRSFALQNNKNIVFFKNEYDYLGGTKLFYSRFNFYMTDINLIDKLGAKLKISDAIQLNFTDLTDSISANKGLTELFNEIPTGNYEKIEFGIGVAPALNKLTPSDFSIKNPLHLNSEYWDGWASFIFSKVEGRIDVANNGKFETPFTIHTGSDQVYKTKTITKDISISKDKTTSISLNINFDILFNNLDLRTNNNIHNIGDLGVARMFLSNLNAAITLN
jgi:hypothetical protein